LFLALDRTSASARARDWIARLASYGPLELVAAHLWWPPAEYQRRGLPRPLEADGHDALERVIRRELTRALMGVPAAGRRLHLEVGRNHLGDQLMRLSIAERADLFIIGTHPHGERGAIKRLWSVSREVLSLAPMSVVCVPEVALVAPAQEHPQLSAAP
jgi:nucleotide-binding universal stress UspA family protein